MIYLPKTYGTCRGAYKAVELANNIGKDNVVVYKEILHNPKVISDLEKKGIKCIDNIDEITNKNEVIIRAHGEGKETYEYFKSKKIKVHDATCPNVIRVHDLVLEKYNEGYQIIIVGKKNHPEVIGTNGWCDNKGIIIESKDEIDSLNIDNKKIYVVAQTTIREENYLEIIKLLKKKYDIEYKNTICNAQRLIQTNSLDLAKKMDIMFVIGGLNSSNTKELFNICNEVCTSYFVQNMNDLYSLVKKMDLTKDTKIGITGGASTPKSEVESYKKLLEFLIYYKNIKGIYEKNIDIYNKSFIKNDNNIVTEGINKFINMNSDGKYVRASLIDLGYKLSGNSDNYAIPLGIAYETFQTAILVHDDIIDNSNLRRGKVTIPYTYMKELKSTKYKDKVADTSNSMGICLGDLGFYYANKIILDTYFEDKNLVKLLEYYNNIVINTIKGEMLDVMLPLKAECFKYDTKESEVMEIYNLKTSWYTIVGPFSLGLILANKLELINVFENILNKVGVAFQIKDDLLGIYGDTNVIGKVGASDISEFKQTILYTYLNDKDKKELHKYYGKKDLTKEDILEVQNIFTNSGAKKYATTVMEELFSKSIEELRLLSIDEDIKNILEGFIIYLERREK